MESIVTNVLFFIHLEEASFAREHPVRQRKANPPLHVDELACCAPFKVQSLNVRRL